MARLATLYASEGPHTVRGLAGALAMSKPAVCRALDRLERLGFARRKTDEADGRNVPAQRTVKGAVFMSDCAEAVGRALEAPAVGGLEEPAAPRKR